MWLCFANFLCEEEPECEEHDVEEVLEDIGVEDFEPCGVSLNEHGDGGNACDVEEVDTEPSERNEPSLVLPSAVCRQQQAEPYERLLECGATPYDSQCASGGEADGVGVGHVGSISEDGYEGIDRACDMVVHDLEWARDVEGLPEQHLCAAVIARDGPFPCVVGDQQCDGKSEYVLIFLS